jgi:hypothetical protein
LFQKIKKRVEQRLLDLCKKQLKSPSKISEFIFEPIQSFLIKRKYRRSYPCLFPLLSDTQSYKKEVKNYWRKSLGIYVNPVWHEIISKQTSKFDPRNLNQEIWDSHIHSKLNPPSHHIPIISDKNFTDFFIDKKYLPTTVFKIVRGNFFNPNNKFITKKEARTLLFSTENTLFVKSSNLFRGLNAYKVQINEPYVILNSQELSFDDFITKVGSDAIIQHVVDQHSKIASMHPASLNTLRIFTLRLSSGIHFLNAFMKFGADNNAADNTGNGVICGTNIETGVLYDYGYDRVYRKSASHPTTGMSYSDFGEIPNYNDAVDLCKNTHKNLFYQNFIAWDVCVQKNGKPMIIELNSKQAVEFYQITSGKPFLGDLTEQVLDEVKHLPS